MPLVKFFLTFSLNCDKVQKQYKDWLATWRTDTEEQKAGEEQKADEEPRSGNNRRTGEEKKADEQPRSNEEQKITVFLLDTNQKE